MRSSLPTKLIKLVVNEKSLLSFQESVLLKDFCPHKIKEKYPELVPVIDALIAKIPQRKYITVDVMKHNFLTKGKTCRDTSFHVDGIKNHYIIWSIGSFRTEFLSESLEISSLGEMKPKDLAMEIKIKTSSTCKIMEAENSVPMLYDSSCIHRGRNAEAGSKRIMIRICSSDYIYPKNVDLKKLRI